MPGIDAIVEGGLCIGCGLCEAIAGPDRLQMVMTPEGRERPLELQPLDEATTALIFDVCPGTVISGQPAPAAPVDPIWGPCHRIDRGFAGDPEIRFKAATGGVLTGLAAWLLESGRVDFVLQVGAREDAPMRSTWQLSRRRADVLRAAGSRYGPAAPLAGLEAALGEERPFAFIGKPCDVGALRRQARHDPRIDRHCRAMLTLVCGGASELGKSTEVLDRFGLAEEEVRRFRYRGYGNPGPTRIETRDGRAFEVTYNDMWADEAGWRLQFRCKICPDAIGEAADVAASDVWPGGGPTGEDAGFNGILARTARGLDLVLTAAEEGALVLERPLTPRDMDVFQPHQVRKKRAVWARIAALRHAGRLAPVVEGLRIDALARDNGVAANLQEARGTRRRIREGKTAEPPACREDIERAPDPRHRTHEPIRAAGR